MDDVAEDDVVDVLGARSPPAESLATTYNLLSDLEREQAGSAEAITLARKARPLLESLSPTIPGKPASPSSSPGATQSWAGQSSEVASERKPSSRCSARSINSTACRLLIPRITTTSHVTSRFASR